MERDQEKGMMKTGGEMKTIKAESKQREETAPDLPRDQDQTWVKTLTRILNQDR